MTTGRINQISIVVRDKKGATAKDEFCVFPIISSPLLNWWSCVVYIKCKNANVKIFGLCNCYFWFVFFCFGLFCWPLFWLKFLEMRRQSSTDFCSTKFRLLRKEGSWKKARRHTAHCVRISFCDQGLQNERLIVYCLRELSVLSGISRCW